jgi:hypothetical protein
MKLIIYTLLLLITLSCATGVTLSPERLAEPSAATGPFDTLAAYRKAPGQPKTKYVQGHWRHTMHGTDSVYVKEYYRSAAN